MVHRSATWKTSLPLGSSLVAALALAPSVASAQAAPAPAAPAVQSVPAPSPLALIPGVTIRYYDVTGNTIEALRASIAAQRPKDPTSGVPQSSSSTWSIGVSVKKSTTGTTCKLIGATPTFKGEVVLPRLVGVETVPAPVQAQWRTFVTSLEQQQADRLRQPYQRLGEVQQAVMASSCEGAGAAANKAIDEITKAPPVPTATPVPVPAPAPAQ